jgi:ABC-type branched-subunit amino acid transport system ATPase component
VSFGSAVVLNKVGFTIGKGVTGLIGPNGSGKTTLLNATSGFVPLRSGTITLNGERLSGLASWKRARLGLARTFQTPKLPKDVLVVEAIAAAAFRSKSILLATMFRTTAWRRLEAAELARAHAIAKIVGLGDVTLKRIDEIAAGQQRLVDIARAIMTRPKVLLLDEPAAGLSDAEVAQLRQLLLRLGQSGLTVVLIDHNLPFVSTTCERAIVLDAGVLIYEGRADCVADDPAVREAYVGIS